MLPCNRAHAHWFVTPDCKMTRTGPGDKAAVKAVAVKAVAQDTELVGKAEAEASMEATGEMGKAAKYSLCSSFALIFALCRHLRAPFRISVTYSSTLYMTVHSVQIRYRMFLHARSLSLVEFGSCADV